MNCMTTSLLRLLVLLCSRLGSNVIFFPHLYYPNAILLISTGLHEFGWYVHSTYFDCVDNVKLPTVL